MSFVKENEMMEPVRRYFESKDFQVFKEARLFSRRIDLVAKRKGTVIAVEMKLRDWNRAVEQAFLDLRVSNYCYVALPEVVWGRAGPRLFTDAASYGIGLLSVDGVAKLIMRPRESKSVQPILRQKFLKQLRGTAQ